MKLASWLVLFTFILTIGSGCSHSRAHIKYSEFANEMPIKTGSLSGTNLGPISGEDGGAIWSDCTQKARGSVMELIAEARKKGGNAIGDVKWGDRSEPTCKKGWGYVVIWPFLLTPLFMSTHVAGNAYKVSGGAKTGLFLLPENPSEDGKVVDQILARN